jgi:MFS family permease
MVLVSRALIGFMNGNVGIIRTMVAEIVPQRELQPRAFSIMPMVWTIGSIFGPAFGGALARPAEKHPNLFGGSEFLKRYPFALPNLVSACFFVVGITTGILFLKVNRSLHFGNSICQIANGFAGNASYQEGSV